MKTDLTTTYLGFELSNPIVAAASPLTGGANTLRRLEEAGLSAAVLPSLFEEQIVHGEMDEFYSLWGLGLEDLPGARADVHDVEEYNTGPEGYLRLVERAKQAVSIPIIASLNGTSFGGWISHARRIENAGADALELNVYNVVMDPAQTAQDVERQYLDLVAGVREAISIPLAVKIGPYFTSLPNMARRLVDAGADGLVLFNRFLQPDIDLDTMRVAPHMELSTPAELRLPLRWIAILRNQIEVSLAASTGVHTARDAVKLLLVGADVTMVASALLKFGPGHVAELLEDVSAWMQEHGYTALRELKGTLSARQAPERAAFERAHYIRTLSSFTNRAT